MHPAELRSRRLFAQGLRGPVGDDGDASGPAPRTTAEVVRRALAVQAQEYLPSQWGLAQRIDPVARPGAAEVAAAVDHGEILRTHVLRPTWHFVTPDDARWLLELSAPRIRRQMASDIRKAGWDGDAGARGVEVIARELDGGHRTRSDLAAAFDRAGLPTTGLGFVLFVAEVERVAISGASAGKQRTYAAFDERVPASPPRAREEALAELVERALTTRGPATVRDLATWSGSTLGDVRAALAAASDRTVGRIALLADDEELWHDGVVSAAWTARPPDRAARDDDPALVDLLQGYDEYVMGHAMPRAYLQPPGIEQPIIPEYPLHAMLAGGTMIGRWAPVVRGGRATLRVLPWRELTPDEERSLEGRLAEVAAFLGVPADVERESVAAV
ncbi:winged helix DNA-binding domain-containing protein [Agromyces endophyticus]|uniref:winged helix DNA-binding domain-containing protein n=1 Tax=Agromyces sp. H17E-10 TaxID=2932244 RepID=UPI001FD30854|nr:winged helix DNA-binding domain-containing protein [Agromyces sp. H17E-10]UOQ90824.1 winged helix DNA-binding domain-containing protein [Agromyces sp. H17E-10]